jgi:hypothetical protein
MFYLSEYLIRIRLKVLAKRSQFCQSLQAGFVVRPHLEEVQSAIGGNDLTGRNARMPGIDGASRRE